MRKRDGSTTEDRESHDRSGEGVAARPFVKEVSAVVVAQSLVTGQFAKTALSRFREFGRQRPGALQ